MRQRLLVVTAALALAAGCHKDHPLTDAGLGDGSLNDGGSLSSPGIYVTNIDGSVTVYALDASGDVPPLRRIGGATTGLSLPIGIAIDHLDDLYVANRTGSTVTVYPSSANGDVAPKRTLTATGMLSPEGLAVGPDDSLFVSTCPSCGTSAGGDVGVYHFPAGGSASDAAISGASTGFTNPSSLTISGAGDLYVGNSFGGPVSMFPAGATGNVAPTRSFTPSPAANLQSISRGTSVIALVTPGRGIDFYDLATTGTAAPSGSIPVSALPLQYPGGVFVDTEAVPEMIYLVDFNAKAIYVITTSGTEPNLAVASVRTIAGASTQLSPLDVTVAR